MMAVSKLIAVCHGERVGDDAFGDDGVSATAPHASIGGIVAGGGDCHQAALQALETVRWASLSCRPIDRAALTSRVVASPWLSCPASTRSLNRQAPQNRIRLRSPSLAVVT